VGKTDEALKQHLHALEARDQTQRAAISALGVDLQTKRVIDVTFVARDESSAAALATALRRNELLATAAPSSVSARWLVTGSLEASVDWITTRANIATFILFADKYECEYDGWGTALVEAAKRIDQR